MLVWRVWRLAADLLIETNVRRRSHPCPHLRSFCASPRLGRASFWAQRRGEESRQPASSWPARRCPGISQTSDGLRVDCHFESC